MADNGVMATWTSEVGSLRTDEGHVMWHPHPYENLHIYVLGVCKVLPGSRIVTLPSWLVIA